MAGRGTAAIALLTRLGIPHTVHAYEHDPRHGSYGIAASEALSIPAERVLKTLWGSRTRPRVLTWASTRPARIR
jgi:Cys-tRNA(Pro)/Cys-tRNA(Cys) deacylase